MYWSGNNNQIYKTLVQLLDDGLVTNKVLHQESTPSRKLYTITGEGVAALKEWALSIPELPEFKKTFLIQLPWADQYDEKEIDDLLSGYESEIKIQLSLFPMSSQIDAGSGKWFWNPTRAAISVFSTTGKMQKPSLSVSNSQAYARRQQQ